ncbi:putative oxidoreductase, short chain dehydrogenase/reductase family [Sclerotinia borealis F-4128]|uniref:Putative oxidoreductase, short chain dehydrogenase/reductase family n=1 Tax=Sclerotinia borealis (strain F-4128) TaxID=1432307 RepID=W9CW11_SCLBF|nr:putative oxidoreductase, short chain dehydrogenase/reductase family [Sclerotinia borealis F-4128]
MGASSRQVVSLVCNTPPIDSETPTPFVVAIIGGSWNIGAATAKAFAQAGATGIIITGSTKSLHLLETKIQVEAAASSPDLKVTALAADLGDPSSAKLVADTITSIYGCLDLLINNSAIVSTHESAFNKLIGIDIDQIQKTMEVNYIGKFALIKALLPLILISESGKKTIINITSGMAHFASMGSIGYNISELALNRLTEAVTESYGGEGMLAYAVHPGIVATMPPIGMAPDGRPWPSMTLDFVVRFCFGWSRSDGSG